jgi:hypothetical protein
MPTDAEIRTLFRELPAPDASIDTNAIIRRSRRRRLPQQLGVGSVLTLAVAGIGFASFTGLQGLTPSMMAADAPAGVAESGTFSGTDMTTRSTCASDAAVEGERHGAEAVSTFEVAGDFPSSAQAGQPVQGAVTLTNTGSDAVTGTITGATVSLTRAGEEVHQHDDSTTGASVSLPPGETVSIALTFDTVGCASSGDAVSAPLEPGGYDVSATLTVEAADGTLWQLGAPASAITIR